MEPYYYNHMDRERQSVYRAMHQGLLSLANSFQVPKIDGHALSDIFFELRLDHPELFWAASFKYKYYADSPNLIFIPEYLFEKSKIKDHQKAMTARVEKLARPAAKLSEIEKEKYIHDFICENIHYDKLKKPYSHEIIGPLGHGVGVCEGIAKSVKILCDALGIWCMIALCGNNPEKGIKYRHTWNIVKIGKTYYHLDATFDNSLGKCFETGAEIRYDYFNLDDKAIFRDHEPLIAPAPACTDGDHFYYKEKKLSFTKQEEVYKRALQTAKKNRTFTFHWRGGYLTREVLKELIELIEKAGTEQNKTAHIQLNWPQAVLRFHYTDDISQAVVTMDEANDKLSHNLYFLANIPRNISKKIHYKNRPLPATSLATGGFRIPTYEIFIFPCSPTAVRSSRRRGRTPHRSFRC